MKIYQKKTMKAVRTLSLLMCMLMLGNSSLIYAQPEIEPIDEFSCEECVVSQDETASVQGIPLFCMIFGHTFEYLTSGVYYFHGESTTKPYCRIVSYDHEVCLYEDCPASQDVNFYTTYANCHPPK